MRNIIRTIAIILTLCLAFSVSGVYAFAEDEGPIYYDNGGVYLDTLEECLEVAESGDVFYVCDDYCMTESAEIPEGVTVIVASSAARNDSITGHNVSGTAPKGNPFATLTIPSGIELTVSGTLLVAGNQQASQPKSGCLTSDYGRVELSGTIEVNGKLYARGIIDGTGSINTNSGAQVYQLFQLHDWRGGTATSNAYNADVFPFNLYKISNIQVQTTYNYGSTLYGQFFTRVTIFGLPIDSTAQVELVGANGLLSYNTSSTSVCMYYNPTTERVRAVVNGQATTGDITASFWAGSTTVIDSSNMILPFGYNIDVEISSGSVLTVTNKIKLLPGCTIHNYGTLSIDSGAALYLYKYSNYSTAYNFASWNSTSNAQIIGSGTITVNGTLAESDANGSMFVKEYIQSTNATVNVPFSLISIP